MSDVSINSMPRRSTRKRSLPQPLREDRSASGGSSERKRPRVMEEHDGQARAVTEYAEEDDGVFEVERILARSLKLYGTGSRRREHRYLVRWQGYGPEHDSWEPASGLATTAHEAMEKYHKHPRPFVILDAEESGLYLVQHGITHVRDGETSTPISVSPLFETEWATADDLKQLYPNKGTSISIRTFVREYECRKRDAGNVTIVGQRHWQRKGIRRLQYSVVWQQDEQEQQEWLEASDISQLFPRTGSLALSDYRKGANVVKAEPVEGPDNDYDRERLNNIEMNRLLLRELGLGGL